jgi:MoxR-like ATPase
MRETNVRGNDMNSDRQAIEAAAATAGKIIASVGTVFLGKDEVLKNAVTALLARGHVLLEDVPGAGKTVLAKALAASIGGRFSRVQFTSDLLPSDITGISVYSARDERFSFHPGPVFANVLLADEINRASPRTQSALLEAMSERQVTVDSETRNLPDPFFVVATQNPHEHSGTYPLPESQLDRFLMRLNIGYPDRDAERRIAQAQGFSEDTSIQAAVTPADVAAAQAAATSVEVPAFLMDYLLELTSRTRRSDLLELGVSTRGVVNLVSAARAVAVLGGRSFCVADDVKSMFIPVCAHRVVLRGHGAGGVSASGEAAAILADIMASTPVPGD